ncbi:hypothetical protein EDB86DRAFT_3084920 [Lactarius hatsudake]|nr:hypothetical protein EDB86DRAFT_3084920 [Lactarius hatsudake]
MNDPTPGMVSYVLPTALDAQVQAIAPTMCFSYSHTLQKIAHTHSIRRTDFISADNNNTILGTIHELYSTNALWQRSSGFCEDGIGTTRNDAIES